jgi:hypothetical protein
MFPSRVFAAALVAGFVAVAMACSTTPSSPVSPSVVAGGNTNADGPVTLKLNTPTLVSPSNGTIFDSGQNITVEWRPAGATYIQFDAAWELEVTKSDGTLVYTNITGASSSNITHRIPATLAAGDYDWRVRGAQGDGRGPYAAPFQFTVRPPLVPPTPTARRTPNPPAGVRLPAPDRFGVVVGIANQYPHYLFNSCQDHGGTWQFMDTLADTLRQEDTRWGYAWKRGIVGDPLLDLVAYNWSSDPDEGTRNIYTIDVLLGHCGSSPTPTWINTQADGGPGLSAWTGRGRF